MENGGIASLLQSFWKSPLLRILLIAFLILLLQIPISMIDRVIGERQSRRWEANEDVTSKWGNQQTIIGPMITVPYLVEIPEKDEDGNVSIRRELHKADFLPEDLHISGSIDCEVRYRGIYKVPIYRMDLLASGQFARPDFSDWGMESDKILWDRAHLTVRISDARAITDQIQLAWNDEKIEFLPGAGDFGGEYTGIHANLKGFLTEDRYSFSFPIKLNGSQSAFFAPFGRDTTVEIQSNWSAPSFQGNWLPTQRDFSDQGFNAAWNIPFLGRDYPQKWWKDSGIEKKIASSLFGVRFIAPVDHYRMAQRSIKYEILFLVLTFAAFWLFEILIHVRIHSVQYLLVGVGMCMFYLLELSLAEHIGFIPAYVCASASVITLVSTYCIAVLKGKRRAAIIAAVTTVLYGYLYILLMNQDYALLIGSIGLFLILAAIMYLTRKIDWYSTKV
ncbi:MAG: cell envelope integrity protein CreD [Candidatus Omnitrophica bacterium]|nr:cell envelope integrity protein CreD [Candidatus Omnitrophota bacterium]